MVINKKSVKKIIVIAIVALLLLGTVLGVIYMIPFNLRWNIDETVTAKSNVVYVDAENEFPYLYKADENGNFTGEDFKIMATTDLHFEQQLLSYTKNSTTIEYIKKNIYAEKPDLVVFTGDIITASFTKNRAVGLAEMMEKLEVYWAPVYGNHDGETKSSLKRDELTELWSGYKYCLIKKGSVSGSGNYIINIKTAEDKVANSLVFVDSGSYMSAKDKKQFGFKGNVYDYVKQDQIDWYADSLKKIEEGYGSTPSLLFMHIALPEYKDAYEKGTHNYGNKMEGIFSSKHNSGMFDKIVDIGSTKAIFVGHDHANDYSYTYKGVDFVYLQKGGYSSYDLYTKRLVKTKAERRQGCNIIVVKEDGSFTNTPLLNTRFK